MSKPFSTRDEQEYDPYIEKTAKAVRMVLKYLHLTYGQNGDDWKCCNVIMVPTTQFQLVGLT